ncbi:glutamate dehydrogenase, partial [Candidatus Woesearchaeota archaeon]|nr:glutamate dehydrogenase [Candidatus Woesearchaeota archaeon]
VMAHKQVTKSVVGFEAAKSVTNEELLELDVEILVPAALEKVITQENAGNVKAKLIVELANGPVTPEADDVLFGKGTIVVPDILANAGGVVVSYFEWVQNRMGYYWKENDVLQKLEEVMKTAFEETFLASKKYNTDMRTAAQIVAIDRILAAERLRGNLK